MNNSYDKDGRIPREELHNQEERLTNKHVKTLTFLKEMASENKVLKQRVDELENELGQCSEIHALAEESQTRIKDIQEKYLARADEINQMLADQHRGEMMQVLDEKMEGERSLKEEILKLRHEIDSLQRTNVELREVDDEDEEKQKFKDRITELELLVEGMQLEVTDLTSQKQSLQKDVEKAQAQTTELHQLQGLREMNQSLGNQLREASQKNLEYVHRLAKLEKESQEGAGERDQSLLVEALQAKVEKLVRDKELAARREEELGQECRAGEAANQLLEKQVMELDQERATLVKENAQLYLEYGKIRRRLQQDEDKAAFKEFVAVKRELVAVKNENEILRLKVRTSSGPLPMLKEDLPPPMAKPMTKKGKKKLLAISLAHGKSVENVQG